MDNIELLRQYEDLLDNGIITQEEYDKKKRELMNVTIATVSPDMTLTGYLDSGTTRPTDSTSVRAIGNAATTATQVPPTAILGASAAVHPKKNKGLLIGLIIGLVVVVGVAAFLLLQPKVVSISATYNGTCTKGTKINSGSPFTVTATYEKGDTKEVTGWKVDEAVLHAGFNDINIKYKSVSTSLTLYAPLVEDGKYVASVSEIIDTVDIFAREYLSNYTGLTEMLPASAYEFGGAECDSHLMLFGADSPEDMDENVVPERVSIDATIYAGEETIPEMLDIFGVVYCALDPEITYEDAREEMRVLALDTFDSMGNESSAFLTRTMKNLKVTCMISKNEDHVLFSLFFEQFD